jgi:hypothetical protein
MTTTRLSDVRLASRVCEAAATPHRVPDFDAIATRVEGDPEVRGTLVFLEMHNTGWSGVLERWLLTVEGAAGPIEFVADLLPGAFSTRRRG